MLMDFEIKGCARLCAVTGQALQPGEVYFSVLESNSTGIERYDYSVASWNGPPENCIGWWRSKLPTREDEQPKLAPVEVMLNLFESLADRPAEREFRYLLGLLLLRRRVLRRISTSQDDRGVEVWELYCARRSSQYDLLAAVPRDEVIEELQTKLVDLLYGGDDSTGGFQPGDEGST